MTLYIGIAILLFFLLFFLLSFTSKEGQFEYSGGIGNTNTSVDGKVYYNDNNVSGAVDGLTALNKKLTTLQETLEGFSKPTFSAMDTLSSINQVLETKDKKLFTAGVVTSVTAIQKEVMGFQEDVLNLNKTLIEITTKKAIYVLEADKVYEPPAPETKTKKSSNSNPFAITNSFTAPKTIPPANRKRVYSTVPEAIDILMLRATQLSNRLNQITSS